MTPLVALGGSVTLNAAAQIALRYAKAGRKNCSPKWPRFWLGIWALSFLIATAMWILAIRQADISYAYPLLGAGYVLVTLLAKSCLGERISFWRWISILVITAGVGMVGASR